MMKREEIIEKVIQIFKRVFDDEELIINDNTCADDIDDWDSLEQINLILDMEKTFAIKFNIAEVAQLKNVGGMIDLIYQKCDAL